MRSRLAILIAGLLAVAVAVYLGAALSGCGDDVPAPLPDLSATVDLLSTHDFGALDSGPGSVD